MYKVIWWSYVQLKIVFLLRKKGRINVGHAMIILLAIQMSTFLLPLFPPPQDCLDVLTVRQLTANRANDPSKDQEHTSFLP